MEFFFYQKSYAKLLSKDFLYNIDNESFRYFLFQTWGVVAVALFQGNISQEPLKFILPKTVSDFTAGRLSKNVKILSRGSMTFVCNKNTQGGGLQKRNIYHICIFDH